MQACPRNPTGTPGSSPGRTRWLPGVHRIPLPLPGDSLKAVNIYAISDGAQVVLVDGGWALDESERCSGRSLATIGYGLGDVREYLVTHLHRDHYTQAVALRRAHGGSVAVGAGEQACLEAIRTIQVHPDVARLHEAGALDLSKMLAEWTGERDLLNWEDPDRWLADGVDLTLNTRTLRVIATPGHTRGHVVFHDPGIAGAVRRRPRAAAHHALDRRRTEPAAAHRCAIT